MPKRCNNPYVANSRGAVKIKLVSSAEEINSDNAFRPLFTHQHFGEHETITGYSRLSVTICYSDCSLFVYPLIEYESRDTKVDNIIEKVRDQLPELQLDALITSLTSFKSKLRVQKKFKPYGDCISSFVFGDSRRKPRQIEVYKVIAFDDQEVKRYIQRAQSLAFWYIDRVNYTDNDDANFFHYFLYEVQCSIGTVAYKFAGYSTLYKLPHSKKKYCARIAHMLLAPHYMHSGNGIRFLDAIYADLRSSKIVYEILVESPAEGFLQMRDFSDCLSCVDLPEYSKENLMSGFTKKMKNAARKKLKLPEVQARRVYEILRLYHTKQNRRSYRDSRADVSERIEKPFLNRNRKRSVSNAFYDTELDKVSQLHEPEEQRKELCKITLGNYKVVLDRLKKYHPNIF